MKLPFIKVKCTHCSVEIMQGQLQAIKPYKENRYVCPNCKTEIKIKE